jgi:flagellar assembly protein FliH
MGLTPKKIRENCVGYSAFPQTESTILESEYSQKIEEDRKLGYENGRSEGFEIGLIEGKEKGQQGFDEIILFLNSLLKSFQVEQSVLLDSMKPEVIRFCLTICKKILHKELSNSSILLNLIERILNENKAICKNQAVKVIISTHDYELLMNGVHTINCESVTHIHFVSEKSMPNGNFRLETSYGLINFDVDRLLEDLEKSLLHD